MVWIPDGKKISKISLFVLTECTHRAVKMSVGYCEIYNSFLVNFVQTLSKSVTICKTYCKKFTATFYVA